MTPKPAPAPKAKIPNKRPVGIHKIYYSLTEAADILSAKFSRKLLAEDIIDFARRDHIDICFYRTIIFGVFRLTTDGFIYPEYAYPGTVSGYFKISHYELLRATNELCIVDRPELVENISEQWANDVKLDKDGRIDPKQLPFHANYKMSRLSVMFPDHGMHAYSHDLINGIVDEQNLLTLRWLPIEYEKVPSVDDMKPIAVSVKQADFVVQTKQIFNLLDEIPDIQNPPKQKLFEFSYEFDQLCEKVRNSEKERFRYSNDDRLIMHHEYQSLSAKHGPTGLTEALGQKLGTSGENFRKRMTAAKIPPTTRAE